MIRILSYEPLNDDSHTGQKGNIRRKVDYFEDEDNDNDKETNSIEIRELAKGYLVRPHDIPIETIEKEMDGLVEVVNGFFERSQVQATKNKGMILDEIELAVEINGEGKIGIIGNGAKVGAKGAIKLKFKRPDS